MNATDEEILKDAFLWNPITEKDLRDWLRDGWEMSEQISIETFFTFLQVNQ